MGCTPSKEPICRNCLSQCSPVRRSYSSYPNLTPPYSLDNQGHHVVELTSTTLGYLLLDPSTKRYQEHHDQKIKITEISDIETKTWSKMIDERIVKTIPKTPIRTPLGEPETINTWELMEGLDDSSPIEPLSTVDHNHCYSNPLDQPTLLAHDKEGDVKKLLHNENDEIMSCRKEKLVLYFTSLRGVRKTYEDCCHVRVILKNSGVRVDERDVSMHSGFKEDLKELLGDQYGGLPKVFIGKKCIGGVDEIRKFHDEFQLDKVLEGCDMMDDHGGGCDEGCEGCGDVRFIVCDMCSGSCKIYNTVGSDECEIEEVESDYGFQRCPDCNENGLVKCPICCD